MDGRAGEPPAAGHPVRSSELLGFPRDARVLVINADDFGMYHAVNAAVIRSIEEGIASSCSLMAPCPAAPHAMRLLRQHPQIPFGIHLTLVCDTPSYSWGPLTARDKVPSLLDETGELFTPAQAPALLAQGRLDEIELEPARHKLRRQGLPVVDHEFLDSFRLDIDGKQGRYAKLLHDLPAGLSEWAVHPALGDKQSQMIDPCWRVRRTDYEFLISPQASELLKHERIVVIDYRTIQQAWSRRPVPPHSEAGRPGAAPGGS